MEQEGGQGQAGGGRPQESVKHTLFCWLQSAARHIRSVKKSSFKTNRGSHASELNPCSLRKIIWNTEFSF